jgi:AhpD family alkylhydroperoxidase
MVQPRLEAQKASPAAYSTLLALEAFVRRAWKLEPSLMELVRMRASQINGCAYCLDMHSKAPARRAKPNSGFIRFRPGARRRFSPIASVRPWIGQKP